MTSESIFLTNAQLRRIEQDCADLPLMQRAGYAAAGAALRLLANQNDPHCVVLCGPGNNGGDGLVAACHLRDAGIKTTVVAPIVDRYQGTAQAAWIAWQNSGGAVADTPPDGPPTLIIDAIFGIGLSRAPTAPYSLLIEWANRWHGQVPILALDIASGVESGTGQVFQPTICADQTLHFIAYKPGAFTGDGVDYCGTSQLATLDVPEQNLPANPAQLLSRATLAVPEVLRRKRRNVHKGNFGTLAVVGGNQGMVGAAIIAARAGLRMGAGKIHVGLIGEHPPYDPVFPELMLRGAASLVNVKHDAWVVGCGMGLDDTAKALLDQLLEVPAPLLLDADALTLLAESDTGEASLARRSAGTLLTPHPAEAARLLHCKTAEVQEDRLAAAAELARRYRACVVLKGQGSVVASPDTLAINTTGNAALAFGGSGDALAGMVGALLAQQVEALTALRFAVCLHGAAADALAAKTVGFGLTTGELVDGVRDQMSDVRCQMSDVR